MCSQPFLSVLSACRNLVLHENAHVKAASTVSQPATSFERYLHSVNRSAPCQHAQRVEGPQSSHMSMATSASSRATQCMLNVTACHLYALRPSFLLVREPTMLTVTRTAMVSAAARPIACSHQITCSTQTMVRQAPNLWPTHIHCMVQTYCLCHSAQIRHSGSKALQRCKDHTLVISVTCQTEKSPAEVHWNLALHWSQKVLQARTTCWLHRWWT